MTTFVYRDKSRFCFHISGEINTPEDRVLMARGGTGGCQENDFQGTKGAPVSVRLDLKLIADIGLVG